MKTLVCQLKTKHKQTARLAHQGVLLDQFGVLHDGQNPYAGAQEAVKWLSDQGLKILILSNSSKRRPARVCQQTKLGHATITQSFGK